MGERLDTTRGAIRRFQGGLAPLKSGNRPESEATAPTRVGVAGGETPNPSSASGLGSNGLETGDVLEAPPAPPSRTSRRRAGHRPVLLRGRVPKNTRLSDEEVGDLIRSLPERELGAIPSGKLFTAAQIRTVLTSPRIQKALEEMRLLAFERLLLHSNDTRAELDTLVDCIAEPHSQDQARALIESLPPLSERVRLLQPEYAALYRDVAATELNRRKSRIRQLLSAGVDGRPFQLTSIQVRELLTLFIPEYRLDLLHDLWPHWTAEGAREFVLGALAGYQQEGGRLLVETVVPPDVRASQRQDDHRRLIDALSANHAGSLVRLQELLPLMGSYRPDAFQLRELLRFVSHHRDRFQALEGLLPYWSGSGDPELFLSALPSEARSNGAELVSRRASLPALPVSVTANYRRALEWVRVDAESGVPGQNHPLGLSGVTLSSDEIARLLVHYPARNRLAPFRTLVLRWQPDGREHLMLDSMRDELRLEMVRDALEVARTVDRSELDAPDYLAFLDRAAACRDLRELERLCRPPMLGGLLRLARGGPPPLQLTSLQLREFLGARAQGHALLLLEALGPSQRVRDGKESLVLALFDQYLDRARAALG